MRTTTLFGIMVVVCMAVGKAHGQQDEWVQLFNGKDLTGWTKMNDGNWGVENGVMKYTGGGNGWIRTNEPYKDFQLIVEWRYVNEGNNDAGVFFRAGLEGKPWPRPAYQLNMGPGQNFASVGGVSSTRTRPDLIHKVGEWNTYDLILIGDKATLLVNEKKAWDASGISRTEAGYIGFQGEGFVLEVRSVKLRKLGAVPAVALPTPAPIAVTAAIAGSGLDALIAPGAKVELVKDGFQFTEGPMCGNRGSLYFSDIPRNQICRINTTGDTVNVTVVHENTNGANGLFMNAKGEIIAACGAGSKIGVFMQDKTQKTIADKCGDKPLNRPNDLTVAKDGRIYFTDPGARPMPGQPATSKPSVYLVKPDGTVVLLTDEIARPNGILLSLDEKTLFVANTRGNEVMAYDVQPDGTIKNKRAFCRLRDVAADNSGADGMCLDQQGNLYVTSTTGVQVFNAKGEYLGTIAVPKKPSNCAFAGVTDRKTLYFTAGDSIFKIRMNVEGPKDRAK
jgi:gluconolactonase